ncbi:MAG: sulfatase-like hydrolase/transferase [Bacilli bacterium]
MKKVKFIIGIIFLILAVFTAFLTNWTINTFGLLSFEEIIYHLTSPLQGTSPIMIKSFIYNCLIPSFYVVILIIIILYFNPFKVKINGTINIKGEKKFTIFPFIFIKKYFLIINIIIFSFSLYICSGKTGVTKYVKNQFKNSDFIEANYADSKKTNLIFPKQKRNLIYIFVESLETTYISDSLGGALRNNLLPSLSSLSNTEINFSNSDMLGGALTASGTDWTIAGMVAQTSGMPLKVKVEGNSYGSSNKFLPGLYSLGDILKKEGYNQMLMLGSDVTFGGRKYYFNLHGDYEIFDYYSALKENKISSDYYQWWGYEDNKLYNYAKEKIVDLANKDKPFNFTMLTADTHFPDGYLEESCSSKNIFDNQFSNVVNCTDNMLFEFISWIKKQNFYQNTTVIISGDHLSMDPTFFKDINEGYIRTVYDLFINSAVKTTNNKNRSFSTLDLFPTTLASLGVLIDGNRLGLGTNLFSDLETLIEKYGISYFNEELLKKSDFYDLAILSE